MPYQMIKIHLITRRFMPNICRRNEFQMTIDDIEFDVGVVNFASHCIRQKFLFVEESIVINICHRNQYSYSASPR